MIAMQREITELLKSLAANKSTITYGELASQFRFYPRARKFHAILQAICKSEVDAKRPMLCSIVVKKDTNMPGKGFFTFAENLGKKQKGCSNQRFYMMELNNTFGFWSA